MTKEKGRGHERRLADMGEAPEPEIYRPPPEHVCDTPEPEPIILSSELFILARMTYYKRRVVDYSIQLNWGTYDGESEPITRIDTKHGTVHQHFFRRGSIEEKGRKDQIAVIPVDNGWAFVHDSYLESYVRIFDNVDTLVRRWSE